MLLKFHDLCREHYHQLVYSAISFSNRRLQLLPPCILKPEQLWSGKQVVSTVLLNVIPSDKRLPNLIGKAKISSKNWQNEPQRQWKAGGTPLHGDSMSESEVIIRNGELLCGVMDKAQVGATSFGLVHLCFELYGGETTSLLLSAFSRLFTYYLQYYSGFSFALDDIALTKESAQTRLEILESGTDKSLSTTANALDMDDTENLDEETIRHQYRTAHQEKEDSMLQNLDNGMKTLCNGISNKLSQACMRNGLLKKFPSNNLQLMVESGAKGTPVNAMQICCLVGQTELEGRRMPLMLNGKTLPVFDAYDTSPEAGGFVTSSYYLGLKPEEYVFQCMAGREGLIDAAVKTSTSGYIQRRLIKHLEGISVGYDLTVRDSDGSVIQFLYGEDGLDVTKSQMLKENSLHLLEQNYFSAVNENELRMWQKMCDPNLQTFKRKILQWKVRNRNLDESFLKRYRQRIETCPDPVNSKFRPDTHFGSVTEKTDSVIQNYMKRNMLTKRNTRTAKDSISTTDFHCMCYHRLLRSLVEPGEAVGILAAQSIGEPSTQMTLNTFHFAGKGEMNVTLGIPRVEEIINATKAIKTPTMDLSPPESPFAHIFADVLLSKLSPTPLKDVLTNIEVNESLSVSPYGANSEYQIYFHFLEFSDSEESLSVRVLEYMKNEFKVMLGEAIKKNLAKVSSLDAELQSHFRNGSFTDSCRPGSSICFNTTELTAANSYNDEYDEEEPNASRRPVELDYPDDEGSSSDEGRCSVSNIRRTIPQAPPEDSGAEDDESMLEINVNVRQRAFQRPRTSTPKKETDIKVVIDFEYDAENMKWCKFSFELLVEHTKMNMKTLLESVVSKAYVFCVPGIKEAVIVSDGGRKMIKTNGVNFLDVFKFAEALDVNKVYSNDIHSIAEIFGIEAAAKAIQIELRNVFKMYGINVDPRHLSLISDYMTAGGEYKPIDRRGLKSCASPLQQMSFETTTTFMVDSMFLGIDDQLKSPSASIIVGQRCHLGTGVFDVIDGSDCT